MKTILLTGATGYLGSELLKNWLYKGHKMVILKRSASSLARIEGVIDSCVCYDVDKGNWDRAFKEHEIDVVVHVAASYGRNGEVITDIVEANTLFPLRVLDLAIKAGVHYFINTASSLPKTINDYSLSKAQFHDWLIQRKSKIHSVNLVLEYFYGPGDDEWKFISMVINKLKNNSFSIDFSSGLQKRDFIYILDVVSAFDVILNKIKAVESGTSIPIGTGESHSLRSVVELCKEMVFNSSTHLNFGYLPDRVGEIHELVADTSIMRSLNWNCEYSLKLGLEKLII